MYVCTCMCIHVCMCVYMCARVCTCMYVRVYVCLCVSVCLKQMKDKRKHEILLLRTEVEILKEDKQLRILMLSRSEK